MQKTICSLFISTLLMLAGCATQQPARPDLKVNAWPAAGTQDENRGWWYVQFIKQWPDDSNAPFHYDLLLAEQVIRPALNGHHEKIDLWRFHRRAGRDAAGSKFSFIFYANADDARLITDHITSDPLVKEMLDSGLIEEIWTDDFAKLQRPDIEDNSDKEWPPEIQKSWPYFIMGVSQSWLALIDEFTSRQPLDISTASLDEIVTYYAGVSVDMDLYWKESGGHAYIHHLSALFAYRPVQLRF